MRLRDVLGPDARGQPIGCVIGPDDRIVEIGEPEGRQDGTEHFLPSHAGLERRVLEDRGIQEVPVLQVRGLRAVTPARAFASCDTPSSIAFATFAPWSRDPSGPI